jgi:transglutaminase-like putative cysteine protease
MKTPLFLIAAALLFWGWRTDWWMIAFALAAIFELSRFVRFRWEFTDREYSRVFDVCTLLFGGAVVYLRFSEEITRSGFVLFQWMPVIFALMLLTQAYGAADKIPYRVFSWFMRLRKDPTDAGAGGLNISWPYFGICLLAAGATNEHDKYFYAATVALCAWAAWTTRIKRYATPVWAACCLLAIAGGWFGKAGWTGLQAALVPMFGDVFARWGPKEFDALNAHTSMGQIGSKKTSGKIVLRVKSEAGHVPSLLRQASFDTAKGVTWYSSHRDFTEIHPENDITTWTLIPDAPTNDAVRIAGYLHGKRGLLSLPQGAGRIRDLPVVKLDTTQLGVARANDGPGVISYLAEFSPNQSFEAKPGALDYTVPDPEKTAIAEIAARIKAQAGTNDLSRVHAVERFFAQNFTYSLYQKPHAGRDGTVLSQFLKTTHTGHCEYFATATVLLLRELEIPARYAVGYSLQEVKGDTWIVRDRHAHAWALAWFDGKWQEVDTTPGTWASTEKEQASKLEPISDFFSDLWFKFSMWRWLGQKGVISRVAPFLILPLVAILVWRIFFRKKRVVTADANKPKFNWPGLDSEYYELEARLAASGHERHLHETPEQWLRRLRTNGVNHPSLPAILDLHYRYRFDPRGLQNADRKRLRMLSETQIGSPREISKVHQ